MSWTARYASLAFTQFDVGLTISGMNEAGLAIETLRNHSRSVEQVQVAGGKALMHLQWVQYQLDTVGSVDELMTRLDYIVPDARHNKTELKKKLKI